MPREATVGEALVGEAYLYMYSTNVCTPYTLWRYREKASVVQHPAPLRDPPPPQEATAASHALGPTAPRVAGTSQPVDVKPPRRERAATKAPHADPSPFETTRAGRVRLPPLAFWCGQSTRKVRNCGHKSLYPRPVICAGLVTWHGSGH